MNTKHEHNLNAEAIYMQLALDTIRMDVITQKVKFVRDRMTSEEMPKAIVRTMSLYKMTLRIAAAVIVIFCSVTFYKIISVSTQSIYNQVYVRYELSTSRGGSMQDEQAEAFKNKNWKKVIALNSAIASPTTKSTFLTGIAEIELNYFEKAIATFHPIIDNPNNDAFRDEAEYYTAMACLASNQDKKGLELIDQIKANPNHTYYPIVASISAIDLKIIALSKK